MRAPVPRWLRRCWRGACAGGGGSGPAAAAPVPCSYRIPPIAASGAPRPARAAGRGRRPAGTPLRQLRAPSRSSSPGLLLLPPPAPCEGTRLPARRPPAQSAPAPGSTSEHGPAAGAPSGPSLPRQAAEEALPALGWPCRPSLPAPGPGGCSRQPPVANGTPEPPGGPGSSIPGQLPSGNRDSGGCSLTSSQGTDRRSGPSGMWHRPSSPCCLLFLGILPGYPTRGSFLAAASPVQKGVCS
ncbi:PREDICTED: translation initiation factor IF-2-like [Pseudopodoces humilis]|uniref:translation initiation factor IF-2-like n=1 Tax=Pseudopodoces humilis TaxID=181119 RepID=UPI0006B87C4E|nr:PREDICTED: translation initiation factor IF-2-like [Pseudopodoces humilis]